MWRYCNPQSLPPALAEVVLAGRRFGLTLMMQCHKPNKLTGTVANGMSELGCFRLQGRKPLDFVEDYGYEREEVAALPAYHFISRNLDTGSELRGRIKF